MSRVQIPGRQPVRLSFASADGLLLVPNGMAESTGPKTSSRAIRIPLSTPLKTVGSTK